MISPCKTIKCLTPSGFTIPWTCIILFWLVSSSLVRVQLCCINLHTLLVFKHCNGLSTIYTWRSPWNLYFCWRFCSRVNCNTCPEKVNNEVATLGCHNFAWLITKKHKKTRWNPRTRMLTRMLMVQMSKHMVMKWRTIPFCNRLFEQSCACFPWYQSAVWSGKCRVWSVECGVWSVECRM